MNDKLEYRFDSFNKEAGAILSGDWIQPQVKYMVTISQLTPPWMHCQLEDWSGTEKTKFEHRVALQACDEAAGLGLDAGS